MTETRGKSVLPLIAFPLLVAAIVVPVLVFRREIWHLFASPEALRSWVAARSTLAPLVFIAIQAVQVIVFVIPGEVPQIAGGYLFGFWLGSLLSILGIMAGSVVSFYLARLLGVPFVHALFPGDKVERVETFLSSRRSKIVFFLLFVIPGIPKDILCYVAGLSPLGFPFFIVASTLGRLPGILASAIIGSAAASGRWILAGILLAAAAAIFGIGYLARKRIEALLNRISRRGGSGESPTEPPTGT